ncbi:hypothetical protein [Acidithiobacillus sp.]|jgi:hypothetical protein|uniref:hypothetical protein n=1 Tax=Acidithiobacillus sp. TaxID=1872118 RepID=UPI0025B8EA33|nr:hypothetical protein [Acidithiobacillus sp.]MCK9189807.1 hypothetical protein [Acidithiobacillus sp.]MCK9360119.1 hypothetical protein [Acidithiobacillus sp.]
MKIFPATLVCIGLAIIPMQSYAADNACVSLMVGAGYAAKMRVVSGSFSTDWSNSFAIGHTECQNIKSVPDGQKYTVQVHAILGKTADCTPSIAQSSGPGSITWQATGTTLNVHCVMPTERTK